MTTLPAVGHHFGAADDESVLIVTVKVAIYCPTKYASNNNKEQTPTTRTNHRRWIDCQLQPREVEGEKRLKTNTRIRDTRSKGRRLLYACVGDRSDEVRNKSLPRLGIALGDVGARHQPRSQRSVLLIVLALTFVSYIASIIFFWLALPPTTDVLVYIEIHKYSTKVCLSFVHGFAKENSLGDLSFFTAAQWKHIWVLGAAGT